MQLQRVKNAAYVAVWLWNVARYRSERPYGVRIGSVANPKADKWSACICHLKYLAERVAGPKPSGSTATEPNSSEVWANLANALALQATDRAVAAAPATKKGFDTFPVTTQLWIGVPDHVHADRMSTFSHKSGGANVSSLRHLASVDASALSRLGRFINQRLSPAVPYCLHPLQSCKLSRPRPVEFRQGIGLQRGIARRREAFGEAAEISVVFTVEDARPMFECYLDDLFEVSRKKDRGRLEAVLPFILHLIGRPVEKGVEESLPRYALMAVSKFLVEAKASETKVILGWEIYTRKMTVSLPPDKHRAGTSNLQNIRARS